MRAETIAVSVSDDEFGTTFGNIYALTGDGFDIARLRHEADRVARELRRAPRLLLHATRLALEHPISGEWVQFALPPDF